MNIDDYQKNTNATAIYPGLLEKQGLPYVMLGLIGEVGEVVSELDETLLPNHPENDGIGPLFSVINLAADVGLLAEQLKKAIRDEGGDLTGDRLTRARRALAAIKMSVDYLSYDLRNDVDCVELDTPSVYIEEDQVPVIQKEFGDVSWYMAQLHENLGINWSDTLMGNNAKLKRRLEQDTLSGDGSER